MSNHRGFLTDTDKEFLRGEKEYTGKNAKQSRYERRRAIRDRTLHAIADLELLYETLSEDEYEKIVQSDAFDGRFSRSRGFRFALAFLYSLIDECPGIEFEQLITDAVSRAEFDRNGRHVDPRFYLNETRPEIITARAGEKVADGRIHELTVAEMRYFLRDYRESGRIDPGIPGLYARWRYGTAKEPPKVNEMTFEEYLDQHYNEESTDDEMPTTDGFYDPTKE
jgi:hypothetical protein